MTGFAIIPDNQPAIAVDHHDDAIRITIGDQSTVLTTKQARQLEAAIGRLRLWPAVKATT